MSERSVRAALEIRLKALTPLLDTAWENVQFIPKDGVPYQRTELVRAEPEDPEMTGSFQRLLGFLQVTLMYPQQRGPGEAEARADLLRVWFKRGTSMTSGSVTVTVDGTPYVMQGFQDGDRWSLPVRIPYFTNISS
jgi:hypothetical protein